MKDDPRVPLKHQLDHSIPTVIHHPEEDLPILARWLKHAMENQTRFWGLLVGLVVVVIGLTVLASGLSLGRATSDEAWTELELAKTAADRVEIAKKFPNTPAERWALLQAATEFYSKGFADLPNNREVALPDLKKALDYFDQVAESSPKDSPQARAAAFGKARTLEARNELDKAIKQYEYVSKTWPDTDEAKQSDRLAELLKKPEAVTFYKDLYAYKPPEVTIPPLGQENLNLPPDHPPIGGSSFPSPLMIPPPPPSPTPSGTPKAEQPAGADLPGDVFAPTAAPAAPKADAPKPSAEPAPEGGLPADVFAPKSKEGEPKP